MAVRPKFYTRKICGYDSYKQIANRMLSNNSKHEFEASLKSYVNSFVYTTLPNTFYVQLCSNMPTDEDASTSESEEDKQ